MATTFTLISAVTVGAGGAASIDFTSIPSTYTDLCLKVSTRGSSATSVGGHVFYIRPNGSSANGSSRYVGGNGSTTFAGLETTIQGAGNASDWTANTFGSCDIYIPNYAGSTNKSLSVDAVGENNGTDTRTLMYAGLWSNTAAITSVSLVPYAGSFVQYSTAYLYGVKNA
jgi:hypothetical protein